MRLHDNIFFLTWVMPHWWRHLLSCGTKSNSQRATWLDQTDSTGRVTTKQVKLIHSSGPIAQGRNRMKRSSSCKCRTSGFYLENILELFQDGVNFLLQQPVELLFLPYKTNKQTKTLTRSSCKVIGNVVNRGIPFFIFKVALWMTQTQTATGVDSFFLFLFFF